jgi:hypothetical protein
MHSFCPKCNTRVEGIFPTHCPACSFNIDALAGLNMSADQRDKWREHTDLLSGSAVALYNKEFNASFNYNGVANLPDIVQFTITFGDRATTLDRRGRHSNQVILAYLPEIIGSGSAIHYPSLVPCSGVMLISPGSQNYAHSYPIIDEWVQRKFPTQKSFCRMCARETGFGVPICNECYEQYDMDWRKLMGYR